MRKVFLIFSFFISSLVFSQITPPDPTLPINSINMALGINRSLTWYTSDFGNGFGHRIINWDPGYSTLLRFQSRHNSAEWNTSMTINTLGNIGIGTENPDAKLTVKGKIHCEEVIVDLAVPADYVFEKYYNGFSYLKPDYTIPTLEEIEAFTKENMHLPNVPSSQEIKKNGLHLKEMTNILLQKIEELTLYVIEQNKQLKVQQKQINMLNEKVTTNSQ